MCLNRGPRFVLLFLLFPSQSVLSKTSASLTFPLFRSGVADLWDRNSHRHTFKSRSCRNSMTCRPTIPATVSPITTTYRKRLLTAFAHSPHLDNDTVEAIKTLDSNDAVTTARLFDNTEHDEEYRFLKQVSTLSSSPQRLCHVSAMTQCCTIQQIHELRDNYNEAAKQLHTFMSNPKLDGGTKHQVHCQHRYTYGRQPFVCKDCWSYLPICICHKQNQGGKLVTGNDNDNVNHQGDTIFQCVPRLPLPVVQSRPQARSTKQNDFDMIDVIMWTHHKEWGSPSNTGSVLVVALTQLDRRNDSYANSSRNVDGHMLMKGYIGHDEQFEQLLRPRNDTEIVIPVVLWAPAAEDNASKTTIVTSSSTSAVEEGAEVATCIDGCKIKSRQENHAIATSTTPKRQFVSVDELLNDLRKIRTSLHEEDNENDRVISQDNKKEKTIRLVMIAVEGTWNQAKRMVTKLPQHVRALHLSDIELFQWRTLLPSSLSGRSTKNDCEGSTNEQLQRNVNREPVQIHGAVSILDPLRKQKTLNRYPGKKEKQLESIANESDSNNDAEPIETSKVINTNKVCTVEAVVSALVALRAIPIPDGDYIINLADQKVIRTVTFQGKMTLRNIISHW